MLIVAVFWLMCI